eukprot:CAMPEP_0202895096 /NCGR_PEP_ID=MMETSP1392-20130828/4369_1 /ASSEMBLY_ACC=CAM_ASM_000868 /TAXON_ID=225041 /ORGANISM="Chlamydomonas chlamydogama, Strain SAG 11-48b" /LENGTH=1752 /DNA_ID=CAMNT_0049580001 /DNA_START=21 /DNA_END=5279 /DNA_ORIENTATION=-
MGNARSSIVAAQPESWDLYLREPWRSDRAKQLDVHGGLGRDPLPRGQSFSAGIEFLQEAVESGTDVLQEFVSNPGALNKHHVPASKEGFMTFSERRAAERALKEAQARAEAHQKALEAAGGSEHRAAMRRQRMHEVAEWRIRIHAARHRVVLILRVVILMKRGKKFRERAQRFEHLGYVVPTALMADVKRFADEQRSYDMLKHRVERLMAAVEDEEAGSAEEEEDLLLQAERGQPGERQGAGLRSKRISAGSSSVNDELNGEGQHDSISGASAGSEAGMKLDHGQSLQGSPQSKAVMPAAAPQAPQGHQRRHWHGHHPEDPGHLLSLDHSGAPCSAATSPGAAPQETCYDQQALRQLRQQQEQGLMDEEASELSASAPQSGALPQLCFQAGDRGNTSVGQLGLQASPPLPRVNTRLTGLLPGVAAGSHSPSPPNRGGPADAAAASPSPSGDGDDSSTGIGRNGRLLLQPRVFSSPTAAMFIPQHPAHPSILVPGGSPTISAPLPPVLPAPGATATLPAGPLSSNSFGRVRRSASCLAGYQGLAGPMPPPVPIPPPGPVNDFYSPFKPIYRVRRSSMTLAAVPAADAKEAGEVPAGDTQEQASDGYLMPMPGPASGSLAGSNNSSYILDQGGNNSRYILEPNNSRLSFESGPNSRCSTDAAGRRSLEVRWQGNDSPNGSKRNSFELAASVSRRSSFNWGPAQLAPMSPLAYSSSRMGPPSGSQSAPINPALLSQSSMTGLPGTMRSPRLTPDVGGAPADDSHADDASPAATAAAQPSRLDRLKARLQQEMDALKRSTNVLQMYANRHNATWAESHRWGEAVVLGKDTLQRWGALEEASMYQETVIRKLKNGQIAFQIHAAGETIPMGNGQPAKDLWTSDPWKLMAALRPGIVPRDTERLEGATLGLRVLCALVSAVLELAGTEALAKLHILLHVNAEQEPYVAEDIAGLFGLSPDRVFVLVQHRQAGFKYNDKERSFVQGSAGSAWDEEGTEKNTRTMGSGHGMLQLVWPGEGRCVDSSGNTWVMDTPVLDLLEERGVQWLVSRRARDLLLLSPQEVVDVVTLGHCHHMFSTAGANMVMEVVSSSNPVELRSHGGSVVLHLKGSLSGAEHTADKGSSQEEAQRRVQAICGITAEQATLSNGTSKQQPPPLHQQLAQHTIRGCAATTVVELAACEVAGGAIMPEALERLRKWTGGVASTGLGRYVVQIRTLRGLLSSLRTFRPKLHVEEGELHAMLDAGDMTAGEGAKCTAVHARGIVSSLAGPESMEALLPLILAQEHDMRVRHLMGGRRGVRVVQGMPLLRNEPRTASAPGPPVRNSPAMGEHHLVIFVSRDAVGQATVQLAMRLACSRGGPVVMHLVHVVEDEAHRTDGLELLQQYEKQARKALVKVVTEVLELDKRQLLDVMEGYVQHCCQMLAGEDTPHPLSPRKTSPAAAPAPALAKQRSSKAPLLRAAASLIGMLGKASAKNSKASSASQGEEVPLNPVDGGVPQQAPAGPGMVANSSTPRGRLTVLLGSSTITAAASVTALSNSTTIGVLRRLVAGGVPTIVVTAHSAKTILSGGGSGATSGFEVTSDKAVQPAPPVAAMAMQSMRRRFSGLSSTAARAAESVPVSGAVCAMAVVDATVLCRGLMDHMCGWLLQPQRGDRLVLASFSDSQAHLTRKQQATSHRVMDLCSGIAQAHHMPETRIRNVYLQGDLDSVACETAQKLGVGLLGLELPQERRSIPEVVLQILRSSQAAVLLYKDVPHGLMAA